MYTVLEVAGVLELHVLNTTIDIHTPVSIREYHIVADTLGKGPVATSDHYYYCTAAFDGIKIIVI